MIFSEGAECDSGQGSISLPESPQAMVEGMQTSY